jgi:hypothetical protein
LRPRFLFDEVSTREIPVDKLRAVDPQLSTLENLNCEQDYFSALGRLTEPPAERGTGTFCSEDSAK